MENKILFKNIDSDDITTNNLKEWAQDLETKPSEILHDLKQWDLKQWAVFSYMGLSPWLISDISLLDIDEDEIKIDGQEILVLTDEEADSRWDSELDSYVDDVILPEIPEAYQRYFNDEKWKDDARFDGRGCSLSFYDGYENQINFDNESIFIYRRN